MENALDYRLEQMEKDVSSLLKKADNGPKKARNFAISIVGTSIAILSAVFAFGDWAIRARIAPVETKVDYIHQAVIRLENKLDSYNK